MSSGYKILPHYSYEDYEQWEGKIGTDRGDTFCHESFTCA